MRILIFHPVRLPARGYGGTERVVLWLAKGLVERGHDVWVAAGEGSRLPRGIRCIEMPRGRGSARDLLPRVPSGTDIVHFMAPPGPEAERELSVPSILTVHGNGKPGEVFPRNSVFLSADHAARHGGRVFVHNGIDPSEYRFEPGAKESWCLFLARTSWRVKNLAGAARICASARAGLRVAGGGGPLWLRAWLAARRSLFGMDFEWCGTVDGARKADLLARARCLIFPVIWPEPFGIAVAEALMSGTPVIASRIGSLPELVPECAGRLIDPRDEDAWVRTLTSDWRGWDPGECRDWALREFHYRAMAEGYEMLYMQIIRGASLHEGSPVSSGWARVEGTPG